MGYGIGKGGGGRDWGRVGRVVEAGGMRVEEDEVKVGEPADDGDGFSDVPGGIGGE